MFGDSKYYHVQQVKKDGKIIGYVSLIGKAYGYIVQLHYFNKPGYAINENFETLTKAEKRFYDVMKKTEE